MADVADNPAGYVCLSFDFDGPSLWIQRGMTNPTSISRGEFGAVAVPRILRLLERRGIPATFFVPGHTLETYPRECAAIADAGCEIGLHGYAHEFNPTVEPDVERWAMTHSFELIERLCGRPPTGYRAPSGELTEATIDLLVEHGLTYDSSLMGHDYQPYRLRRGDRFPDRGPAEWGEATSLVELPWSWTTDDYVYLEFVAFRRTLMPGLRRPADMFDNFAGDVRWMVENVANGVVTFVFHPQVIGRGHRLLALEAMARRDHRARRQLRPPRRHRRRPPRRPLFRRRAPSSMTPRFDAVGGSDRPAYLQSVRLRAGAPRDPYPYGLPYELDDAGMHRTAYDEVTAVVLWRRFLEHPESILSILYADED